MNVVNIKQKRNDGLVYLPNETKPFTGMFVDWHPNGQKKDEVNYIDGWAVGTHTVWYENGQKKEESNYKDGKETSFIVMRLKKIGINPKKWYFVIFTVVIIFFLNQIH